MPGLILSILGLWLGGALLFFADHCLRQPGLAGMPFVSAITGNVWATAIAGTALRVLALPILFWAILIFMYMAYDGKGAFNFGGLQFLQAWSVRGQANVQHSPAEA